MHEQLRVSDLKDTLEKERSERVEVGASLVERDREVHRLLAEIERREIQHARDLAAMKKAWQREKTSLIIRAKDIAATGEERYRDSIRKAKRKLDGQQKKIAALSVDKVTLLEERGKKDLPDSEERAEESYGGSSFSVFERELSILRDRQMSYDKAVGKT